MNNKPIVSICIPTNGRPDIIKETLDSIVTQTVDEQLYEVCISDGSPTDETEKIIKKYFEGYKNIKYVKSNCKTSFNLLEALKLGNGKYLKLHNDYCKFKKEQLIEFLKNFYLNNSEDTLMFFALGSLNNKIDIIKFNNFDKFIDNVGIQSTWAPTFCISKSDFDELMRKKIKIEMMFPHLSLLYALSDKKIFIVNDIDYIENIPLKKKGGYNLPNTFVNIYLGMTKSLVINGRITKGTFNIIRKKILKFVATFMAETNSDERYYFSFDNYKNILKTYYSNMEIIRFHILYFKQLFKLKLKRKLKIF